MPDIYDEAIADRKKLLEVAENNAKNKIIDAVTPRIKELVESALLGKLNEEFGDEDDIMIDVQGSGNIMSDPMDAALPADPMIASELPVEEPELDIDAMGGEDAGITLPDQDGKVILDVDAFLSGKDESGSAPQLNSFELTPESIKALSTLVGTNVCDLNVVNERIIRLESRLKKLVNNSNPNIKDVENARQIKLECERLYANVQASREVLDESRALKVEKKLENMFHHVMENYSAVGHLKAVILEMMAINRHAAKLNKQINESRHTTGRDVKHTARMMRQVLELHTIVENLYRSLGKDDSVDATSVRQVGANLATLYTEIRNMVTKKGKRINEADELDVGADVTGAGGDPEASMDDMDDMGGDVEGDVDADQMLVQLKLPASLSGLMGGESVEVVSVEPATDDEGFGDESGEDLEGSLDDMGAGDFGEDEEADAGMEDEEMDMEENDGMYEARLRDDDIIEIDEAALVAEMKKMKQLREKKKVGTAGIKNVNTGGHGPAHFDAFGGGKEDGEKFVDGEDLNAHDPVGSEGYLDEGADLEEGDDEDDLDESDVLEGEEDLDESELEEDYGVSGHSSSKKSSESYSESRKRGHQKANQNGRAQKQLAEAYKTARAELAGQKLFNTKLVALNRVLQIPGLKQVQKEKVVEILDKGRTVAEVKQLYGKVVEALKRKSQKAVNESAQRVTRGLSSRATTSGASTPESESHPLLERWQKIAFGGSDLIQG